MKISLEECFEKFSCPEISDAGREDEKQRKEDAPGLAHPPLFRCSAAIYREIAPLGHASAQVPHSVHCSGSIEYFSPSEIAPTGHSSIHVPQATQSSLIT